MRKLWSVGMVSWLWAACSEEPAPPPVAVVRPPPPGETLAAEQNAPMFLWVDASGVYWVNTSDVVAGGAKKGLYALARGAAAPVLLLETMPARMVLVADEAALFWADLDAGEVWSLPKAGGTPAQLSSGWQQLAGLAIDAQALYVLGGSTLSVVKETPPSMEGGKLTIGKVDMVDAGDGAIWAVPKRGGKPKRLVRGLALATGLVVTAEWVYWREVFEGTVMRAPKKGGKAAEVLRTATQPWAYAVDGEAVLLSTGLKEPRLERVGKPGAGLELVAQLTRPATGLVVDATHIYWADAQGVRRVAKGGGAIEDVVELGYPVQDVALDLASNRVVWSTVNRVAALPRGKMGTRDF